MQVQIPTEYNQDNFSRYIFLESEKIRTELGASSIDEALKIINNCEGEVLN